MGLYWAESVNVGCVNGLIYDGRVTGSIPYHKDNAQLVSRGVPYMFTLVVSLYPRGRTWPGAYRGSILVVILKMGKA